MSGAQIIEMVAAEIVSMCRREERVCLSYCCSAAAATADHTTLQTLPLLGRIGHVVRSGSLKLLWDA